MHSKEMHILKGENCTVCIKTSFFSHKVILPGNKYFAPLNAAHKVVIL